MKQYLDLLEDVLENGYDSDDRTGVGTRALFGKQMKFDLQEGFPAVTTKKLFFKGVVAELLWMISGSTNAYDLPEYVQHWWTPWADDDGELGPVYGKQLRGWAGDQLQSTISGIRNNQDSRRHVMTLWNADAIEDMNLPPCHGVVIQFDVQGDELHSVMFQRSGDLLVGVPVNIASYSLLTHMVADVCGLTAASFGHFIGNAHIYNNHIEQVETQLAREPHDPPELKMNSRKSIDDFVVDDFNLIDYHHDEPIKAPVAV